MSGSKEPSAGAMVVVAAGEGRRFGGPKQWAPLAGKPLWLVATEGLLATGRVAQAVVVLAGPHLEAGRQWLKAARLGHVQAAMGGPTRQQSVAAGLAAIPSGAWPWIGVHDAARPVVPADLLDRLIAALAEAEGSVPVLPIPDTLRWRQGGGGPDREAVVAVGTPQLFREGWLRRAHREAIGAAASDDATLVERLGGRIAQVAGDPAAFKVTWPEDLARAEAVWLGTTRWSVGQGLDHHRLALEPGARTVLAGVEVGEGRRLVGHSDGDAVLHAVANALRASVGLPDIGTVFPSEDPAWKGLDSRKILREALDRLVERRGQVERLQVTVVAAWPRLSGVREAMEQSLARELGVGAEQVTVHATSGDGLGPFGRGEGVEVHALVQVRLRQGLPSRLPGNAGPAGR